MENIKIKKVNNYMALLRNLRNISRAGVSEEHLDKVAAALVHQPAIENSKQLPFRFYSAYKQLRMANSDFRLIKATEKAMELSIANLPRLEGNVASLCDNSGSAHGTFTSSAGTVSVAEIANLTAVLTGMITNGNASVFPFGSRLMQYDINQSRGVFDQLNEVTQEARRVGQSDETGIWTFWHNAIAQKQHWDNVFVYSDMQAGHGKLYARKGIDVLPTHQWSSSSHSKYINVAAMINDYREQVNPDVHVFLVQVAGYDDSILPEIYDKTYIIGGWSDAILKFANKMTVLNP